MWLVIFALSAAAQPACLQLSLTVPKQRILVGEATKVIVTLRAVCHVDMPRGRPGLLLDDGTGYRQFLDVDEVDESLVIEGKRRLRAGSSCRSSFRMAVPAHFSTDPPELQPGPPFAFPKAGNYQVQAYWPGLRSNVVSVIVVEPQGEDARAWEDLRKDPELLTWVGVWERPEKARDFIAKHIGSPYVAPVQLALWQRDVGEAITRDYAKSAPTMPVHATAVLGAIESAPLSGTPFDVDRFLLVAQKRVAIRDGAGAKRVYERIAREYPETPAADEANASAPPLSLELTTAQDVLLVGEPLRLNLRWQAHRDVPVPPAPGWDRIEGVRVWIAAGDTEREYHEAIRSVREELTFLSGPLQAGREDDWDLLLHMGLYEPPRGGEVPQLAFPKEGRYRVQMDHGQDGWQVHSNWLTVTVTEPKGEDRALLDELGPNVRSLKYGHVAVQRLLDRYPRSPYLQLARVHAFSTKETRARQGGARQLVRELSAQPNWGAFEDVRLGFLERLARVSGDGETAERAARELKARYPRSPMTRALRH